MMARLLRPLALAALAATTALPALAQEDTGRIRGTIESFDGSTLVVRSREGQDVSIALAPDVSVSGVQSASASDISEGDFVGVASIPNEDGSDGAIEVLIFPEAMAGAGEGSYPWDLQPGSTMTNATVSNAVEAVNGRELTLTYPEGERTVSLPEDIPVVTFADATKDDLVAGAPVFVPSMPGEDGGPMASFVVVGMNGVAPPM